MTDREKLVELLSYFADGYSVENRHIGDGTKVCEIADHLITHGVTVRQMQKPLTVEELKQMYGCLVWVEVVDNTVFADAADDFDGLGLVGHTLVRTRVEKRAGFVIVDHHFEDYLKEWRCWAKKPKEEERKAAEWEK